eukprot:m.430894 g.430894  ORF g.430894 m.430894 type:complete len:528 (-) comp17227_c0_seq1:1522-3105(-)
MVCHFGGLILSISFVVAVGCAVVAAQGDESIQYQAVPLEQLEKEFLAARAFGQGASLEHGLLDKWWEDRNNEEYPPVSILTMSNGQRFTDRNALFNVLYQRYPRRKLELIVLESNGQGPDPTWVAWAAGRGGLDSWSSADERALNRGAPPLKIIYRWYNSSHVCAGGRQQCAQKPKLGLKRNVAIRISSGDILINMDNDDVYHPNYVAYVVHHMRREKLHELAIANHSELLVNPDSSVTLTQQIDYFQGGHSISLTRMVVSKCGYGAAYNQVEESSLWACTRENLRKNQRAKLGPTVGTLGNKYLMVKSVNPMSVTAQAFGLGDKMWNRLRPANVISALRALTEALYRLHELQRENDTPQPGFIKLAKNRVPFQFLSKERHPFFTKENGGNLWLKFHFEDYPHYAQDTAYPYCRGFAYMPGITILPVKDNFQIVTATSVQDCCQKCADMYNAEVAKKLDKLHDNVNEGYCGAFQFDEETKQCQLGMPQVDQGRLFRPDTIARVVAGARVSFNPKVGAGLAAADGPPQ